jgi:hypothetical protein
MQLLGEFKSQLRTTQLLQQQQQQQVVLTAGPGLLPSCWGR